MFATSVKRMKFVRALQSRPFAMIWIGQTISNLGDGMFYLALAWQVLLMTHSATAMGIVLIAGMIPRLVFVLIGGVTADRLPRRLIILCSHGGRAVVVLLIPLLAFPAPLPFCPPIAPAFIALSGPMGAFTAHALSFFISVAFLLPVRTPERHMNKPLQMQEPGVDGTPVEGVPATQGVPAEQRAKRRGMRGILADVGEGMVYVRNSRWLWVTLINAAIGNIGIMASLVTSMPKLVHDVYGQCAWLLGLLGTTEAVGSVLAVRLVGQAPRMKKRGLLAYLSMTLNTAGLLMFGLPFPRAAAPIIAPLASVLVGFGIAFFNTIYFTILHERIPSEKLGRVISLDTLGSFAMIPVGEAVGGILTDHIGPALVFIIFGAFNVVNSLIPLLVREVRETE